jgi:hypothetical protein
VSEILLAWRKFPDVIEALKAFQSLSCIYAVTDAHERILRIGESGNFRKRYWGGTGHMLAALMHGSGNLIFVAEAPPDKDERRRIEAVLTFQLQPPYCKQGMCRAPRSSCGKTCGTSSKRNCSNLR